MLLDFSTPVPTNVVVSTIIKIDAAINPAVMNILFIVIAMERYDISSCQHILLEIKLKSYYLGINVRQYLLERN